MKSKMKKLIFAAGCVFVVLGLVYFFAWREPLPNLANIQTIKANFRFPDRGKVTFEVPRSDWSDLYSTLLPSSYDWSGNKWVVKGDLEIIQKNGSSTRVTLFSVSEGSGAFAVDPGFVHYRGGDSSRLQEVLFKAYQAESKK